MGNKPVSTDQFIGLTNTFQFACHNGNPDEKAAISDLTNTSNFGDLRISALQLCTTYYFHLVIEIIQNA